MINQIKANPGIETVTVVRQSGRRRLNAEGDKIDLPIIFSPFVSRPKLAISIIDPREVKCDLTVLT